MPKAWTILNTTSSCPSAELSHPTNASGFKQQLLSLLGNSGHVADVRCESDTSHKEERRTHLCICTMVDVLPIIVLYLDNVLRAWLASECEAHRAPHPNRTTQSSPIHPAESSCLLTVPIPSCIHMPVILGITAAMQRPLLYVFVQSHALHGANNCISKSLPFVESRSTGHCPLTKQRREIATSIDWIIRTNLFCVSFCLLSIGCLILLMKPLLLVEQALAPGVLACSEVLKSVGWSKYRVVA